MYRPPFTVSSKAINLIAKISGQIEKYAINKSSDIGNSGPFIDFMLEEILNALVGHQGKSNAEIADLKKKGIIRRVGANKNGYWEVLDYHGVNH